MNEFAERMSSQAKKLCRKLQVKYKATEPRDFGVVLERHEGKLPHLLMELEGCVEWCREKNRHFSARRFNNWCKNSRRWAKDTARKEYEEEKMKKDTQFAASGY